MYVQRQLNLTDSQVQDFFEVAQYHFLAWTLYARLKRFRLPDSA